MTPDESILKRRGLGVGFEWHDNLLVTVFDREEDAGGMLLARPNFSRRPRARLNVAEQCGSNYFQQFGIIRRLLEKGGRARVEHRLLAALRIARREHDHRD